MATTGTPQLGGEGLPRRPAAGILGADLPPGSPGGPPGEEGRTSERRLYGDFDPVWIARFGAVSTALAILSIVAGVLVLAGRFVAVTVVAAWSTDPGVRPMQVLTAVSFVLLGVGVLLSLRPAPDRRWLIITGRVAATIVLLVGVGVLLDRSGLVRIPPVATWAWRLGDVAPGERLGVPANNTGAVVVALSLAVILLSARRDSLRIAGQVLAMAAGVVVSLVLVAFLYGGGGSSLAGFPFGSGRMELSSAIVAFALAAAVVLARPASGLVAPLASPWAGGILLRRLLPLVLVLPPVAVALMFTELTSSNRPRALAGLAVIAAALLAIGLFTTAAAINRAGRSLEVAADLTDRAHFAVKDAATVVADLRSSLVRIDPDSVGGIEVASRFQPAEGWLAGDAVAVRGLGGKRLGVVIVDAAGHGSSAALLGLRVCDLVLHSMLAGDSPGRAVASVRWAFDSTSDLATAVVAEVDGGTGACRYAVAGHPPPLVRRGAERRVDHLDTTGPLLFSGVEAELHEGLAVLAPGDVLVLYTDGLADPQAGAGTATIDELAESMLAAQATTAEELADWCMSEARGRARGRFRDDAALVAIRMLHTDQAST